MFHSLFLLLLLSKMFHIKLSEPCPCIIPSKRVVICVSKVLRIISNFLMTTTTITTTATKKVDDRQFVGDQPEGITRKVSYGGTTISVKILCRRKKRVNLQCIKYLPNATCHSVFSHRQQKNKVCLLETRQFSSFFFLLFLTTKNA